MEALPIDVRKVLNIVDLSFSRQTKQQAVTARCAQRRHRLFILILYGWNKANIGPFRFLITEDC